MNRQKGFTLVEMVVVSSIVAILLAIGVPSYTYVTNSYRISNEVNGLLGDLQFARAEAIKEGQPVTLCASRDGFTCNAGSLNWHQGWIVFSNPNGNATVDAGEAVLRVQRAFVGKTAPDTFIPNQNVSTITYNREGFATTAAGFPDTTFRLHDPTNTLTFTRCVWVTPVGLARTETPVAPNNPSGACN